MKKLMFLAVVASATVASAVTCVTTTIKEKDPCTGEVTKETVTGAGTAHKVAITLKTTGVKATVKKNKKECSEACTYYRVQATKKINGLLWEQFDDCEGCVPFGANSAFWTSDAAIDAEFAIGIGRIGKSVNSKTIEAYGTLSGDDFGTLAWAGFGSMAGKITKVQCEEDACVEYVKSISGGIAGQLIAPEYDNECIDCDPIEYVGCCDDLALVNTAAYGTIKITYDTATAKKVAIAEDADDIASFVKLPAAVAEDITVNEVVIEE